MLFRARPLFSDRMQSKPTPAALCPGETFLGLRIVAYCYDSATGDCGKIEAGFRIHLEKLCGSDRRREGGPASAFEPVEIQQSLQRVLRDDLCRLLNPRPALSGSSATVRKFSDHCRSGANDGIRGPKLF
jgi:hypothetical protein